MHGECTSPFCKVRTCPAALSSGHPAPHVPLSFPGPAPLHLGWGGPVPGPGLQSHLQLLGCVTLGREPTPLTHLLPILPSRGVRITGGKGQRHPPLWALLYLCLLQPALPQPAFPGEGGLVDILPEPLASPGLLVLSHCQEGDAGWEVRWALVLPTARQQFLRRLSHITQTCGLEERTRALSQPQRPEVQAQGVPGRLPWRCEGQSLPRFPALPAHRPRFAAPSLQPLPLWPRGRLLSVSAPGSLW